MQRDQALDIGFSVLSISRRMHRLTWSLIGINIVIVSGSSNVAIAIDGSTMRTDAKFAVQR